MERQRRRVHPPERLEARLAPAFAGPPAPSDPGFAAEWALRNTGQYGGTAGIDIGATTAWQATTGSRRVVVAVIDSGIDLDHPDLAPNLWTNPGEIPGNAIDDDGNGFVDDVHGWDFVDHDAVPEDGYGHGTHIAGIIGAAGNNGFGVTGVAWEVSLMVLRVLDDRGAGSAAVAAAAVDYATRMRRDFGIDVVVANLSWVLPGTMSAALDAAVGAADAAGITLVTAAGNFASDNDIVPRFPASSPRGNVIAVAALDNTGRLAAMSNWGATTVDLAAPGTLILSTWPGGGTAQLSGTSMAAPFVSGAVALVASARPGLSPAAIRAAVLGGAAAMPGLAGRVATGGRLDLPAALHAAGVSMRRPPVEPQAVAIVVTARPGVVRGFVIDVAVRFSAALLVTGTPVLPLVLDARTVQARLFAMPSSDTLVFRLARPRPMPRRVIVPGEIVLPRGATLRGDSAAAARLSVSAATIRVESPVAGSPVVSVGT